MRYLTTTEDMERQRAAAWDDGFHVGAVIGAGLALAFAGAWALMAGVVS